MPRRSDYHKALDKARDLYMLQVLPRLEEVLDELCPPELVVELDSLAIDLGDISGGDWEAEFVEKCLAQFGAQLREKLAGIQSGAANKPGLTVKTPAVWQPELMVRYLEKGSFGAAASSLPPAKVLLLELLDQHASALFQYLAASPELHTIARRLVYQFPLDLVARLRSLLMAKEEGALRHSKWINELRLLATKAGFAHKNLNRSLLVTEIWLLLEALAGQHGNVLEGSATVRQRLRILGIEDEILKQKSIRLEPGGALDWVIRFFVEAREGIPLKRKMSKRPVNVSDSQTAIEAAWELVWEAIRRKRIRIETAPTKQKKETPEVTAEMLSSKRLGANDAMPVSFAGIVLLNPFIQNFFEHLGLVSEGEFQNESAQFRGVYLLHYLATMQSEAEEGELPLLKLICGLPINEPIFLDSPITEAEKTASLELLQAVIDYWPSMQDSSPEALQEAFLRRAGTLEEGGTGARLRVEPFMLDVLLAKLPWGLSIVHYPWMQGLLYVEWG